MPLVVNLCLWSGALAGGVLTIGAVCFIAHRETASYACMFLGLVFMVICLALVIPAAIAKDRWADRKVEECLAEGGTPDRHGRMGNNVSCHHP